jgi:hypothetical protein
VYRWTPRSMFHNSDNLITMLIQRRLRLKQPPILYSQPSIRGLIVAKHGARKRSGPFLRTSKRSRTRNFLQLSPFTFKIFNIAPARDKSKQLHHWTLDHTHILIRIPACSSSTFRSPTYLHNPDPQAKKLAQNCRQFSQYINTAQLKPC